MTTDDLKQRLVDNGHNAEELYGEQLADITGGVAKIVDRITRLCYITHPEDPFKEAVRISATEIQPLVFSLLLAGYNLALRDAGKEV